MDLSIVIASYNTCDITRRCLESIIQQTTGLDYEIIVVDNASTDGTVAMIESEFPSVGLICNTENRGFAAAQNTGLKLARGRYLLILNSDALFVGNAGRLMVDYLERGPADLGVIGPQILNPDGTIAPSARRTLHCRPMIALGMFNRHFDIKRFLPDVFMREYLGFILARWHDNYARHDGIMEVEYVDGMCVLVKREVLEETGLFDEQFFFDYEIIDLSNRIRRRGWRIEYFPRAQVVHLKHSSRKKVSRIILETHRSELIYLAKYAPGEMAFVRGVARLVVLLRVLLLQASLFCCGSDHEREECLRLYQQIIEICRRFEAPDVWRNERIPSLASRFPRDEALRGERVSM